MQEPLALQEPGFLHRLLQRVRLGLLDLRGFFLAQALEQVLARQGTLTLADRADVILTGARLLLLKSRHLLPSPASAPPIEAEDPPEELPHPWADLGLFKGAIDFFRHQEEASARSYPRFAPYPLLQTQVLSPDITLAHLAQALEEAQRRQSPQPLPLFSSAAISLSEKMAELEEQLTQRGRVSFRRVLTRCRDRREQVVCFLALLQLMRQGRVRVLQERLFSDILIQLALT